MTIRPVQPSAPASLSDFAKACMALVDRMNNEGLPRAEREHAQQELSRLIRGMGQGSPEPVDHAKQAAKDED